MTRAKAEALVLVNWKGVFYERYLLDSNVTALEGANGAGKTTVMIAAYVVLFPDLTRLRFTNVGETGATGGDKGIWGRLGAAGRPSYAAMLVTLGEQRYLLGVHLERKTEPALELTSFLAQELPPELKLSDLLLRQSETYDEIPTLPQFRQAVAQVGGKLQVFSSTKDYFAKLFELGLSPLRLAQDEERNKFNDMLRTSMTGGISRTLTSELRWFVFRQDTGLSDTLGRMRGSLNACRRTRTEVIEARRLEHEVSQIFDAGLSMFAAGFFATKRRAQELFEELSNARTQREQAQVVARERALEANALNAELQSLSERLSRAEAERAKTRDEVTRFERALTATQRLAALESELNQARAHADTALAKQRQSALRRAQLVAERRELQDAVARSAAGLAHLQSGLDELHRKAHAHRVYRRNLDYIEAHLDLTIEATESPSRDVLEQAQSEVAAKLSHLDSEIARRERESQALQARRSESSLAQDALRQIEETFGWDAQESPNHSRARTVLTQLQRLELDITRVPSVQVQLEQIDSQLEQQSELLQQLAAIGWHPASSAEMRQEALKLEANLSAKERELREAEWLLKTGSETSRNLERELLTLREQHAEWERLEQLAQTLGAPDAPLAPTREAVRKRSTELETRALDLRRSAAITEQRRDSAKRETSVLEATTAGASVHLTELCDALEGELLSRRYEDVDIDQAPILEATLGPLVDAIVVEDLSRAQASIAQLGPDIEHLWLIEAGAPVQTEPNRSELSEHAYVAVSTPSGLRLSRVKDSAKLGRKARERRLAELHKTTNQAERTLAELSVELDTINVQLRDVSELSLSIAHWLRGSREQEISAHEVRLAACRTELDSTAERISELPQQLADLKRTLEVIRPLLPQAPLLDATELAATRAAVHAELATLLTSQQRWAKVHAWRSTLASNLEVLRAPPPSDEELLHWQAERNELGRARDEAYTLQEALQSVAAQTSAKDWHDAERLLAERDALAPALEEEHAKMVRALQSVDEQMASSETDWERNTALAQQASGQVMALEAHRDRTQLELEAEGFAPGSGSLDTDRLLQFKVAAEKAEQLCSQMLIDAQARSADAARVDERRRQAQNEEEKADSQLLELETLHRPAQLTWETLSAQAAQEGVLALLKREAPEEGFAGARSATLENQARNELSLLHERLERSTSGLRVAQELQRLADSHPLMVPFDEPGSPKESAAESLYLGAWRLVRTWLSERVPARIAESGDPLLSLSKLREELRRLEQRLTAQESELRGESSDVARNIEVQMRKATNQVKRLNQHLSRVSFGTISAIRIRLDRVERTAKVLEALHDGSAQALLFHSALPIEEAMEEIFRRYGGGRGGGQRLLDYREYLELNVEIQRQNADAWERANPSRLSTGEAIGVGAALMMVILTEWERDATLLRATKSLGTLRFLFLDEANRLSRDNLGVLFELCETLELQLLIAAPEVAHVDNNTTYRLVRRLDETGQEEVIVTGRRGLSVEHDEANVIVEQSAEQPEGTLSLFAEADA